jgi:hypothetical protein
MSDTPRTDAARGFHDMDSAVDAEAMEKLEIEFNIRMGMVRLYKDLLSDYKELFEKTVQRSEGVCDDNVKLARKLNEVKVDADALAASLTYLLSHQISPHKLEDTSTVNSDVSEANRQLQSYRTKYL